jgi:hypothetical protein
VPPRARPGHLARPGQCRRPRAPPGRTPESALRSWLSCLWRDQIRLWWARASTLIASASSLSPATCRCRCRSVRTRSASTFGVARIGLRPRGPVAVPVPVDRERVDGMHGIPRCDEGTDQQAPIQLDAQPRPATDPRCVCRHHLVQLRRSVDAFGQTALGQYAPLDVQDAGIVMGLRPIDPDEVHPPPSRLDELRALRSTRRPNGPVLARHDIPPAVGSSPAGGGTI